MVKLSHKILRQRLLAFGLTQEAFAERLGISERHVRNLCYRDVDVSVSLCYRISCVLQTPMENLLVLPGEDTQPLAQQAHSDAYRQPMPVTRRMVFPLEEKAYYVCPRCNVTLEREFVSYCDRCGQYLNWSGYKAAAVVESCR